MLHFSQSMTGIGLSWSRTYVSPSGLVPFELVVSSPSAPFALGPVSLSEVVAVEDRSGLVDRNHHLVEVVPHTGVDRFELDHNTAVADIADRNSCLDLLAHNYCSPVVADYHTHNHTAVVDHSPNHSRHSVAHCSHSLGQDILPDLPHHKSHTAEPNLHHLVAIEQVVVEGAIDSRWQALDTVVADCMPSFFFALSSSQMTAPVDDLITTSPSRLFLLAVRINGQLGVGLG